MITEHQFEKLVELARISCSHEDKKVLMSSLAQVLVYVSQLEAVDTENVETTYTVLPDLSAPLREDVEQDHLSQELFLSNAPAQVGGMVKVPSILKTEEGTCSS